jgi:hypothetical protein
MKKNLPILSWPEVIVLKCFLKVGDHPVHQNIPGLQSALKLADKDLYPNIHTIFELLIVLPVTSVGCERSFSALRRLKTWVRSAMTGERLCSLAMLHSHRNFNNCYISLDKC